VFQPLIVADGHPVALDVALHAFYPIPNAELAPMVDELRGLAAHRGGAVDAPLDIAVLDATARDMLRGLVTRYAGASRLLRLTVFAQHALTAAINWGFRGEERARTRDAFKPITVAHVAAREQRTILAGTESFSTMPVADQPAGFVRALDAIAFGAASPGERMQALEAMAEIENPMAHGADTAQCVACHVTTFLTPRRSQLAGIDPTTIRGRYTSPYDLAVRGPSATNARSLRAFGYLFAEPMISQRVVNDTAQVLGEIEARFPAAP
jgi:hypothetical protein